MVDGDEVREMVHDHWRALLMAAQKGDAKTAELMMLGFEPHVAALAEMRPEEERELFLLFVEIERDELFRDYERDPDALKQRLGVPALNAPAVTHSGHQRMGLGELAVRTAVRATVWEMIISLFRLFRR